MCSFTQLSTVAEELSGTSIALGAQNMYPENRVLLRKFARNALELGVQYVILGHSKDRDFGETDEFIREKIGKALEVGLIPILCVGKAWRKRSRA